MAITLKRQLTDDEKQTVLKQQGRRCFATGHEIPEGEPVHFDHVRAFAVGGPSETANVAPMCGQHNREKGTLPLEDFRVKLRLQAFFNTGDKLTLGDLLKYLVDTGDLTAFGQPVAVKELSDNVVVESPAHRYSQPVYQCPTTGWKYFYATLDIDVLDSDDDDVALEGGLQPRYLIIDKVFDLYRHFQNHPVLQPSIGRIARNTVRLFDGQHKIAALLWTGRRRFECKVYLQADVRLLNQTNILAHDKFAQTRFFSSVMVMKLGKQFGVEFEAYKNLEDGHVKSESGFMEYLLRHDGGVQTKAEVNKEFRSYIYSSVLEHDRNQLKALVSSSNRGTNERPLTLDMLQKSLFSSFLYREPTTDDMTADAYKRDDEVANMVEILNQLYDLGLCRWNPKAGANDGTQRRLGRIVRSRSMMAWSELLHDAICAKLELHDTEDRARPLYRHLSKEEIERAKSVVSRLMSWTRWDSPTNDEIDRILSDNKSEVKDWFKKHGLTTGYLMGASE